MSSYRQFNNPPNHNISSDHFASLPATFPRARLYQYLRSALIDSANTLPIPSRLSMLFFILISMFCLHKQLYRLIRLSIIWNYVISIAARLQKLLDFLLYRSFYNGYEHDIPDSSDQELTIRLYEGKPGSREEVECAVCLCKIEEGEEIRELRCDHLFHRICLNRWLGYKGVTCPLCRDSLFLSKTVSELGVELLLFKYCCFHSSDRRETWWLR